jgi:competence protein ComEC
MESEDARRPRLPLTPFAPAALGAMLGVVGDRYWSGGTTAGWIVVTLLASAIAWMLGRFESWLSVCCVAVAFLGIGAARHHSHWFDLDPDDLSRGNWSSPGLVWVRGNLADKMVYRASHEVGRAGATHGTLEVTALSDGKRWVKHSGWVLLSISGDARHLKAGEAVEAAGMLAEITGPLNPGESDARDRYRAQGIRLRLAIDEPSGIWRDPTGALSRWRRWVGACREFSHDRLVERMDQVTAPLASALLLGQREEVDAQDNDAFSRTGTMHLLAISGLHLAALTLALQWILVRLVGMNRYAAYFGVILLTLIYSGLVGFMPSVVRSVVMSVFACLAVLRDRGSRQGNVMSSAVVVSLLCNPSDLFDVGCQLSYLGVAALIWVVPLAQGLFVRGQTHPLDLLERQYEPRWRHYARMPLVAAVDGVALSLVVWLVGLPLVMLRFHLASPVGVLLNLPLVPMTSIALMAAGMSLLVSFIWPPLAWPFSKVCSWLLGSTQFLVRQGAALRGGHWFVAGPSWVWVLVFYGLLAFLVVRSAAGWPGKWPLRFGMGIWVLIGLVVALAPPTPPKRLEADVLAVGHGLAVIVRSPANHTMIYDCGRMGEPRVGRRVIAPALWSRGVQRIDTVVLSHADSDHYNGLPDLIDRFRIGEVLIPPGFGGPANPEAIRLLALLKLRKIPIRPLAVGDRVDLGHGVDIEVLHPPRDWLPTAPDNDRSLVLDLSSVGRHCLLTGDLDGAGLPELRALPSRSIDVFLAPHHGGRSANPRWLYDWARPGRVVVSQRPPRGGSADALSELEARGIPVMRTWRTGAVRLKWYDAGVLTLGFVSDGRIESDGSRASIVRPDLTKFSDHGLHNSE